MSYQTSRRKPVAIFQDNGLRRATNPHVDCGKSQNSKLGCLARGFCPPFWGGTTHSLSKVRFCLTMLPGAFAPHFWGGLKFCTSLFFNFGPGGIAPVWDQVAPLLLTVYISGVLACGGGLFLVIVVVAATEICWNVIWFYRNFKKFL